MINGVSEVQILNGKKTGAYFLQQSRFFGSVTRMLPETFVDGEWRMETSVRRGDDTSDGRQSDLRLQALQPFCSSGQKSIRLDAGYQA